VCWQKTPITAHYVIELPPVRWLLRRLVCGGSAALCHCWLCAVASVCNGNVLQVRCKRPQKCVAGGTDLCAWRVGLLLRLYPPCAGFVCLRGCMSSRGRLALFHRFIFPDAAWLCPDADCFKEDGTLLHRPEVHLSHWLYILRLNLHTCVPLSIELFVNRIALTTL
jgi:hypothetical protein